MMSKVRDMKTIVLFDTNWHGHHPTYLKLTARVLIEEGHKVWLCCREPGLIREWLEQSLAPDRIKSHLAVWKVEPPEQKGWFARKFPFLALWRHAAEQVGDIAKEQRAKPDLVLFMMIDHYAGTTIPALGMDVIFPFPWAGLFIHLDFSGDGAGMAEGRIHLKRQVFRGRNCRALAILQEHYLRELETFTDRKVLRFPDVTDEMFHSETALSRAIVEKARGRKIISLLGGLDERKGLTALFDVACHSHQKNWFFVFAGKMPLPKSSEEIKVFGKRINGQESENCYFHFELLEDGNEMNSLVRISDILFSVYGERFSEYSSNVATKAALFCKPLLVRSGSLLGRRVEKFGTGMCCDGDDAQAITAGIEDLLAGDFSGAGYAEYFSANSQERLRKAINDLIESTA